MKVSTKGRYGLRAMIDLAVHGAQESVTLAQIAQRQEISQGYLEQIFSTLRKAGVVVGIKGPQGGYALGRPAGEIAVRELLDLLEGDLFTVVQDTVQTAQAVAAQVALHEIVWERLAVAAAATIEHLTLGDLAQAYERILYKDAHTYYI